MAKEYDYEYQEIFTGLNDKESPNKRQPSLWACHNLEPEENKTYKLHDPLIDMNENITWV